MFCNGSNAYAYRTSPHHLEFHGDEDQDTMDSYNDIDVEYIHDQMDEDDYHVAQRPENPMYKRLLDECANAYTTDESELNGTFTSSNYSMDSNSSRQFYCTNTNYFSHPQSDSDYESDGSDIAIVNSCPIDLNKKRIRTNSVDDRSVTSGSSGGVSGVRIIRQSRVTKNRFISDSDHLNILNYESHIASSSYFNDYENSDEIISSSPIADSRTLLYPVDSTSHKLPSNLWCNVESLNNLQMDSK